MVNRRKSAKLSTFFFGDVEDSEKKFVKTFNKERDSEGAARWVEAAVLVNSRPRRQASL